MTHESRSDSLKAERLNRARKLLQQFRHLPVAVVQMAIDCGLSPRQAYRDLHQARCLNGPVPIGDAKIAFTVKLSQELVRRLRSFAHTTDLSGEIVSRALLAALPQKRRRR